MTQEKAVEFKATFREGHQDIALNSSKDTQYTTVPPIHLRCTDAKAFQPVTKAQGSIQSLHLQCTQASSNTEYYNQGKDAHTSPADEEGSYRLGRSSELAYLRRALEVS